MKILLDENLDCRLIADLPGYEVKAVAHLGWAGLHNMELLAKAEEKFQVFMTMDNNTFYQSNILKLKIPIIAIKAKSNRLADTRPLMPKVLDILPSILTWKVMVVS
jgi:predicted nuclease of predicted toxin-antitoxin system